MPESPHSKAIPCARDCHEGDGAQETEPECLIEVRLEGEVEARARGTPDSIVVAGDYAKGKGPGGKPRVVRGPAPPPTPPALVEAVEPIPEERVLRHQEAERRIVKFPLL